MNFEFATVDMKQEIVDALKVQLPKFGYESVRILKSDPQSPSELPCIGVNRVSDDEGNFTIGDNHGVSYDPQTKIYKTEQGTFFSESMEIRVWHLNADERDKLYQVVKAVLFAYRMPWVEKGLRNITLRQGRDEQDSSMANAPTVIYWSVITMSYMNPLNVDIIETVEPITSVTDQGTLTATQP